MVAPWSLFWRAEKGCWVLKYKSVEGWAQKHLPTDIKRDEGPRKRKPGTKQLNMRVTRAETWAAEWLSNAEMLKLRPRGRPGGLLLRIAAERWKEMRAEEVAQTSPATLRRFGADLRNIMTAFPDGKMTRSIGDEDVVSLSMDLALLRRWFRALVSRKSAWRARSAFSTLRSFFDDALVEKWVRGVNPMKNEALVREQPALPNKADRGGIIHFELEQIQQLVLHQYVTLGRATRYLLAVTLGNREGEIAGLSWGDLHLEAKTPNLDVVRARRLVRRKGEVLGPLKTHTSRGVLPIHPAAVAALHEWRDDQETGVALILGRLPRSTDPVFPSEHPKHHGGFSRPRSAEKLRIDMLAAGLEPTDEKGRSYDMQSCRKSFGTWLRRLKVSEPIRKALMRHGANDVTEDFYTENLPEMAEAVARIPLTWAVVPRVVPTLVPKSTKVRIKPNSNAEPRVGLEPTTCALRKRAHAEEGDAQGGAEVGKVSAKAPKDSARAADRARATGTSEVPGTKGPKGRRSVAHEPTAKASGPGVARVPPGAERVRVEVDGAELAATDLTPGEAVSDVEARLRLAVGQKGGLR
jgi:integrase